MGGAGAYNNQLILEENDLLMCLCLTRECFKHTWLKLPEKENEPGSIYLQSYLRTSVRTLNRLLRLTAQFSEA